MILVTGATGTNGSELIRQLTAANVPVRALVRDLAKAQKIAGSGVELVEGDFDRPQTLDAALAGVEKAFLLPPFVADAVELQRNFIAAAQRAGVRHVVKLSVMGADIDSPIVLGRWHGEAERILRNSGLQWTLLRPNGFMQNLLAFAPGIAADGNFYQPAEQARISFVDVRDIATVAAKSLSEEGHEGKTHKLTGPAAVSFSEVAKALSQATGKTVTYVPVTPERFRVSMAGNPSWMVDSLDELYGIYRAGYAESVTDTVERVTGRPATSIQQFAHDHAAAFAA